MVDENGGLLILSMSSQVGSEVTKTTSDDNDHNNNDNDNNKQYTTKQQSRVPNGSGIIDVRVGLEAKEKTRAAAMGCRTDPPMSPRARLGSVHVAHWDVLPWSDVVRNERSLPLDPPSSTGCQVLPPHGCVVGALLMRSESHR